ncbi:flagellar basal body-associated FliL family protein [Aquabacter cavernae]|uniref:flagellar basal body-associated FliL family protein n=1 Tax=Aquabacter cavernae TaxID=2496029 RepID=UPI000F8F795C|nr:flagellar basal body-associated FliL family protein [Aquabacter cavernae]
MLKAAQQPLKKVTIKVTGTGEEKKKGGLLLAFGLLTLVAIVTGVGLGFQLASTLRQVVLQQGDDRTGQTTVLRYNGDMVIEPLKPIIANLAAPTNAWVRIEGAIIFKNGDLPNPQVAAAQIREDISTYFRTLTLSQLGGPSAMQNLREDLNERAKLRVEGRLAELVIEQMVVQ